jgi:transcriptional regulator with XRE-family HTH domain
MPKKENIIGRELKKIRRARNMSQAELAKKLNVSRAHIIDIEKGTSVPGFEYIVDILKAIGERQNIKPRACNLVMQNIASQCTEKERFMAAMFCWEILPKKITKIIGKKIPISEYLKLNQKM